MILSVLAAPAPPTYTACSKSALRSMMRVAKNLARDACACASALYYIAFALALRLFHDSPSSAFCVFAYVLWEEDPISLSNSKALPRLAPRISEKTTLWKEVVGAASSLQAVAELLFLLPLKIFFQPPTIYNGLGTKAPSASSICHQFAIASRRLIVHACHMFFHYSFYIRVYVYPHYRNVKRVYNVYHHIFSLGKEGML